MNPTPPQPPLGPSSRLVRASRLLILAFGCLVALGSSYSAQVTTDTDNIGALLNAWFNEGSAAGLGAITYENRDDGHSLFPYNQYPQLKVYDATPEEKKAKLNVANANRIRPYPLLGNASMAAPANTGGSIPRIYEISPNGLAFLQNQYFANNLFFYPEHQDYHAGFNGRGGWGDLYPTNTPFMIVSQGSSFTDQPFLRAFFRAAAALRPEVQQKLIAEKMLVPTLVGLFRQSNSQVRTQADYFTAAANPPVFQGSQINEEKFVHAAHELSLASIPPVVILNVLQEDKPQLGRDYFEPDPHVTEELGPAFSVIARVFRGSAYRRHLRVSASHTKDLHQSLLTFKWVVLQGDPDLVKIHPDASGAAADVDVAWQPGWRLPSGIVTHRVDIGVFASNGFSWSAPAFITFYMLPNEARFYRPDGRLEEICYEAGNPDVGLPPTNDLRWLSLARKLAEPETEGLRLLRQALPGDLEGRLEKIADDLAPAQDKWRSLAEQPEHKKEAEIALSRLLSALQDKLAAPLATGGPPLSRLVENAISDLANRVTLYTDLQTTLAGELSRSAKPEAAHNLQVARHRLEQWDVLRSVGADEYALTFSARQATAAERYLLREFHLTLLSEVLLADFLDRSTAPAFVDPRITSAKAWRDLYHYSSTGELTGWTRLSGGRHYEFDAEGRLSNSERGSTPVAVKYVIEGKHLVFGPQ